MTYAVDIGSGDMIYVPSFIRTGSGIQTSISGIHRHIYRQTDTKTDTYYSTEVPNPGVTR
jgi:hypothetical protein